MLELNQNKSANRKTGELTAYFTRATGKAFGTQQNTGVSQSPGKICKHCTMQKILVQVDNLQAGKNWTDIGPAVGDLEVLGKLVVRKKLHNAKDMDTNGQMAVSENSKTQLFSSIKTQLCSSVGKARRYDAKSRCGLVSTNSHLHRRHHGICENRQV